MESWSRQKAATLWHNQTREYIFARPTSLSDIIGSPGFLRASWHKQSVKSKGLSEAEIRERPSKDPSIVCPIDNRILRDAVKTPCCGTAFCEDCIQTHLLEKDFICPNCASKVASLDKLAIDRAMRQKVADYITKEIEVSQREEDGQITNESTPTGSVFQVMIIQRHVYLMLFKLTCGCTEFRPRRPPVWPVRAGRCARRPGHVPDDRG